ncbi:MAG: Na/Pi cotransporter family protein [Deltaproteobacteria bacterium]|nr:Na/Pi cotransporter family protein [Deltaproteobacteria bacterium]MBW2104590.1 Na/Pi cotransporter family protein [Deltaproteobacteria bacterium]MBW2332504.1 Na/Pi cotransporter family protein [Deltaproteobacteria bacterium]HDH86874.1 Na/Pi cotransporter family protein [Desulfobacteraceae bacterium]
MQAVIFQTLGGLGLFIFGMRIMSDGLKKVAGKKLRAVLSAVSSNRVIACLTGTVITSIIQSSSATTVMLVGFVDAGLMTLAQAVGVVLGANIGTTVTAQLIAFNISNYALPAIAAGVLLRFFFASKKWQQSGEVLLGFGILFFGLATMKAGLSPLRGEPAFIAFLTRFQAQNLHEILLCVLVGAALTTAVQSSSATVGITMALASQGLLSFAGSVAMILGENIGTTVTAQLAGIGTNINARRTAMAHTLFNVFGVIFIICIFPYFVNAVAYLTTHFLSIGRPELIVGGEKPFISRHIANAHTLFNVINAVLFLFILPYLAKAAIWLTPRGKEEGVDEIYHIKYLDRRYLDSPEVALVQTKQEIIRMADEAQKMFDEVVGALKIRNSKKLAKWKDREDVLDNLQKEITDFLVKVMQQNIIVEESKEITTLMRMTNNIERIGDEVEDIAEALERMLEDKLYFSEEAIQDYEKISSEARKFLALVFEGIKEGNKQIMPEAVKLVESINQMTEEMRLSHHDRLFDGVCEIDRGMIFSDILNAFEKMGGCCYNVAQAIAGVK